MKSDSPTRFHSMRAAMQVLSPATPTAGSSTQVQQNTSPEGRRSHVLANWRKPTSPTQSEELSSLRPLASPDAANCKAPLPNMFEVMTTDDSDGGGENCKVMFESDATDSWELKFHRNSNSSEVTEEVGTDSWELKVKNTFLHINEDGLLQAPAMRRNSMDRSKSVPPVFAPRGFRRDEHYGTPSPTLSSSAFTEDISHDDDDAGEEGGTELPLERSLRLPSWSVGSQHHGTGSCKPCAWYYKSAQGCQNGEECLHCHLCPLGEIRRRRKRTMPKKRYGGGSGSGGAGAGAGSAGSHSAAGSAAYVATSRQSLSLQSRLHNHGLQ
mmetsp:Transcript_17820/g.41545  ORF Transcript_17820/g.41545 Transcript_17820/m.41545 type:complete len:325 (+) Transcript_17820:114-1088(+)